MSVAAPLVPVVVKVRMPCLPFKAVFKSDWEERVPVMEPQVVLPPVPQATPVLLTTPEELIVRQPLVEIPGIVNVLKDVSPVIPVLLKVREAKATLVRPKKARRNTRTNIFFMVL